MATLKDIAKQANVSTATVSRYLNKDIVIKQETEKRIREAIDSFGYVPNVVAKSLKSRKTNNVAVVLPKINHLYYSEITSGISQILGQHHYNLYIYELDNLQMNEDNVLQQLRENMVAGIIFIGLFSDESFKDSARKALDWDIPIVYANREIEYRGYPLLYPDMGHAGFIGIDYLYKQGKRKMALLHKKMPDHLLSYFVQNIRRFISTRRIPLF